MKNSNKLSTHKKETIRKLEQKKNPDISPTPQAARYKRAGDPKPPAPITKMDDFKRFDCPATKQEVN